LILHWRSQWLFSTTTKMNTVSFQQNKGAEEEGDEWQDFPHSLKLGDECESKKNLENEDKTQQLKKLDVKKHSSSQKVSTNRDKVTSKNQERRPWRGESLFQADWAS
jgi:hypothetical protein